MQGASGGCDALIALGAATGTRGSPADERRPGGAELGRPPRSSPARGARSGGRGHGDRREATWRTLKARSPAPAGRLRGDVVRTRGRPVRVYFRQLAVVGSTMGTRAELEALIRLLVSTGLRPAVDTTLPLERAGEGLAKLAAGDTAGKIVLTLE